MNLWEIGFKRETKKWRLPRLSSNDIIKEVKKEMGADVNSRDGTRKTLDGGICSNVNLVPTSDGEIREIQK